MNLVCRGATSFGLRSRGAERGIGSSAKEDGAPDGGVEGVDCDDGEVGCGWRR
jgi:hypothetical protein